MGNIKIRKAVETDYKILANLGAKTFRQTYRDKVKSSDMSYYIKNIFNKNQVLKEIKDLSFTILVASKNGKAVGYAKLLKSEIPSVSKPFKGIELVRVYVLKNHQGQKIGSKLLGECAKIARKRKFRYIWLGVWEKNNEAIDFYKKSGFKLFGNCKFSFGTDIHNDLLMKKRTY
jgi:ribosomal protein S18 acetylase RimI-like enzyme